MNFEHCQPKVGPRKIVGKVTSSTWSPYQVCGVGIVLLDNSEIGPGTVIDVECLDNKIHKAELCITNV